VTEVRLPDTADEPLFSIRSVIYADQNHLPVFHAAFDHQECASVCHLALVPHLSRGIVDREALASGAVCPLVILEQHAVLLTAPYRSNAKMGPFHREPFRSIFRRV
jgi:hypothetical protein